MMAMNKRMETASRMPRVAPALYSASGSRWTESGSLVDGEVLLDEGSSIVRVMLPKSDGSLLRLNDDGPLVLRDYFGSSGDGVDLTVWIQTAQGAVSFAASDVRTVGYGEIPPRQKDIAYPDHRQALRMRCLLGSDTATHPLRTGWCVSTGARIRVD